MPVACTGLAGLLRVTGAAKLWWGGAGGDGDGDGDEDEDEEEGILTPSCGAVLRLPPTPLQLRPCSRHRQSRRRPCCPSLPLPLLPLPAATSAASAPLLEGVGHLTGLSGQPLGRGADHSQRTPTATGAGAGAGHRYC